MKELIIFLFTTIFTVTAIADESNWNCGHLKIKDFFELESFGYKHDEEIEELLAERFPKGIGRPEVTEALFGLAQKQSKKIDLRFEEGALILKFNCQSEVREDRYFVSWKTSVVFEFTEQEKLRKITTGADFTLFPKEMKNEFTQQGSSHNVGKRSPLSQRPHEHQPQQY